MKTKLTAAMLAILLLVATVLPPNTASADATGICFVAINDNFLELSTMPSFVGGSVYLPASVFKNFGITYNYFESDNTALLYNTSKQVFFNLNTGESYDSYDTYFPASATVSGGQVCFPAYWTCSYFGLSFSYIQGKGYGDVARVKNGTEILADDMFLSAASYFMRDKYSEYLNSINGAQDPAVPENDINDAQRVYLAVLGLPDEKQLNTLQKAGGHGCFFLTEDEILSNPDLVRRISGSGHNIGLYCEAVSSSECDTAVSALFSVAQIRPVAISFSTEPGDKIVKYAEGLGIPVFKEGFTFVSDSRDISALISGDISSGVVLAVELDSAQAYPMNGIVQYLTAMRYEIYPLRETSF